MKRNSKNSPRQSAIESRFEQLHPFCKKCPNQGECPLKEASNKTSKTTLCFSGNRPRNYSNYSFRKNGLPVIIPESPNEWKRRLLSTLIEVEESPINTSWFRFAYRPFKDEPEMDHEKYKNFVNPQ